jgi:enamine deaminase RidA (YjgF/YER057c/UK114 family)
MTVELINPEGLGIPESYSQVAIASGQRLIFIAGQTATDEQYNLIGAGDLAAQAMQAFGNVGRAISAIGVRPDQIAKITIYVVGYRPEYLPAISAARIAVFGDHKPADTLLGVAALAEPGCLIEVDAFAITD